MSQRIQIRIVDKIATCLTELPVVCGNSDYEVEFLFDKEWEKHNIKTGVFVVNGESIKQIFEGNICKVPVIQNTLVAWVGVFAGTIDDGTLSTSTPAIVRCKPCVTDGENVPAPPKDDVYNQIVKLCEGAVETAESVERRAENGEFTAESKLPLEEGESNYSFKQKAPSLRPNKELSQSSVALGEKCIAGCRGYYISEIYFGDENNKPQVRLSSSMPISSGLKISSSPLSETSVFVAPKYSEGAYFNITCADHYFYVGSIDSVNHDVVTFTRYLCNMQYGFQQSANSNVASLTSSSFRIYEPGTDDYSFWVSAEPEIGIVSISNLAYTFGGDLIAAGIMSASFGKGNISGESYSFTINRENIAGYCAFAGGYKTMALAKYSGTLGYHTITTMDAQFACGFFNKIDTNALLMVGNGTSEGNRSNIFSVYRDGVSIGGTKLTEAQLKNLIALPSELETALDSIIAIQQSLIGGTT